VIAYELHPCAWSELGTSFNELIGIVRDSGRAVEYLDRARHTEDGPGYGAVLIS
jgi:hypothetical protein